MPKSCVLPTVHYETGVYCWKNLVNGKVYVGGAYVSLEKRRARYLYLFSRGECHNRHLLSAWKKYGADNFEWVVIERHPKDGLEEREAHWIAKLRATEDGFGYNLCLFGRDPSGIKRSEETRQKISNRPEAYAKCSKALKGRKRPEEVRRRIAEAHKGKKMSEEARANMSRVQRALWETIPVESRKRSEEVKQKIRNTKRERNASAEQSAAMKARHEADTELRERIAAQNRGRKNSEETKERMKQSALRREESRREKAKEPPKVTGCLPPRVVVFGE